ncbi:MAG: AMP-binding protein [Thermoanaerobaculia bacterium]|nr:AMP-binding protein [Thermoanaerobaculia bacterium]
MNARNFTLFDLLERNAQAQGGDLALVAEDGTERSFGELRERCAALGGGLAEAGLARGDRVAILAQNFATYFELYFACARQGVIAYPFNWRWSGEEIERMLERARPSAFVADQFSIDKVPATVRDGAGLRLRAVFDGEPPEGWVALSSLADAAPGPRAEVAADDPFAVIATAAVDVIPRGALLSHANVLSSSAQQIGVMSMTASDRNLLALPLFHIAGLGNALAVFQAGGANVVMPKFDPDAAVRLIDSHAVTFLSDFPPVLTNVLDAAKAAGSRLPSLRVVSGLDAPDTMRRLEEETERARFWTGFGQTETSGFVTIQRFRDLPGAAGKAAPMASIRVVDDYDNDVAAGEPGEILVRGPVVFLGYDGQEEVTAHTFRGGWHHTGDVGRFDDQGNLYYVKRKPEKELIKPGGENVYPAEVESVVAAIEGVTAVCVIGVPDPKWGEGIKAVIESARDDLTLDEVRGFVGERIAGFKRPGYVEVVDRLPRADDGEIDRDRVKERWGA